MPDQSVSILGSTYTKARDTGFRQRSLRVLASIRRGSRRRSPSLAGPLYLLFSLVYLLTPKQIVVAMEASTPDENTMRVHQTAARLSALYELLARLHYIPSASIKYPPHDPPVNIAFAESFGIRMDPLVIEFLQKIPYIEENNAGLYFGESDALFGGGFLDFRDQEQLIGWQRSDPWKLTVDVYGEGEVKQNMPSHMIPVSKMGKTFKIVCLYDARKDTLKFLRYSGRAWNGPWTTDPTILGVGLPSSIPIVTISNPREVDFDDLPGVPAREALDRMINAYENLNALPTMDTCITSKQLKHLYVENHWGSDVFDLRAFEVAKTRLDARYKHTYDVHGRPGILDGIERDTWSLLQPSNRISDLEEQLLASTTLSNIEDYELKWQLKQAQIDHRREARNYQKNTVEGQEIRRTSIPEDEVPLQELSELTESLFWNDLGHRRQANQFEENIQHMADVPHGRVHLEKAIARWRSKVEVLRAAWYESKSEIDSAYRANPGRWRADDYRVCLVLDWKYRGTMRREHESKRNQETYVRRRTLQWEEYKGRLDLLRAELRDLEEFLEKVPNEAETVKHQVEYRLEWVRKGIKMIVDTLDNVKKEFGIEGDEAEVGTVGHDEL
ncbi:hypothetical protein BDV96DRAFT_691445 [Lophiotrema nucula]|uniref:Uncharacterized protein n=1 Tax=Lophiotrema nucula TaxID=690887 RepID=A0A6A5YUJ6_9PLEO|nr:hypothetical protein BDV96DRAFT_691445 [Lophiotrema nucula]